MQTKKTSFANLPGKLSRTEMRMVMAGGGETTVLCGTAKVLTCSCDNVTSSFYCCDNALQSCLTANGCGKAHACAHK